MMDALYLQHGHAIKNFFEKTYYIVGHKIHKDVHERTSRRGMII
jgi:hypothetical protein